jgi:hypothetical protein
MVTRNEIFPSKYLKAADLSRGPVVLEIRDAPQELLTGFDGRQERKTVLYFTGTPKKPPLNRTNWNAVADTTGEEDSDRWPGHKIELYSSTTEMNGKVLPCVRVRTPMVRQVGPSPLAPTDAAAARADAAADLDDELKF